MDEYDPDRPLSRLSPNALIELSGLVEQMSQVRGSWFDQYGWKSVEPGVYMYENAAEQRLISRASSFLYDQHRIILMDWSKWQEREPLMKCWTPDTAEKLDHLTVRKLLSYISRLDHWSDDAWEDMFEEGKGLSLFTRLLYWEERLAANPMNEKS